MGDHLHSRCTHAQSGLAQSYLLAMLLGGVILVGWLVR